MKTVPSAQQIDTLLPQTQCGLCGFDGCMPYAKAIHAGQAPINLCPPGGLVTLYALAEALAQDATPYIANMLQTQQPPRVASIREAECIGCTKCIQACPVDAIIGSTKTMHTVITKDCTGCALCVAPCPVDCIDMHTLPAAPPVTTSIKNDRRKRFQQRKVRLAKEEAAIQTKVLNPEPINSKLNYIEAAIARAKARKNS